MINSAHKHATDAFAQLRNFLFLSLFRHFLWLRYIQILPGVTMSVAIKINNVSKKFGQSIALKDISLNITENEMVALIGPSGSGKSTLLRHIAGLEQSDRNVNSSIEIYAQSIQQNGRLNRNSRNLRNQVGVIFQQFNLINRMSVLSNVLMGSLGRISIVRGTLGLFSKAEKEQALQALERVGLEKLAWQRASTLSGGQQQRVAIARCLMQQAKIILADEPIASLDPKSAKQVMKHLRKLRRDDGKTVVVTLHQVDYARKYCKRVIALVDGEVAFDGKTEDLTEELLHELYGTSLSDDDDDVQEKQITPVLPGKPDALFVGGVTG